ncbi:40S ribosomal protein S17.e.B, partial [Coemansia sp. RSA 2530]
MGRVRTKTVKRASRVLIEKYYPVLTLDFHTNKRICDDVAIIASKRLRNKIAGFTTHLMKRIQKGPVRGISFKLQEEERERKDNYVPDVSAIDISSIEIDPETESMLKALNFEKLPGVSVSAPVRAGRRDFRRPRPARPARPARQGAPAAATEAVSSNLTTLVTHVVTKDTGLFCRKYLVSAKVGIPIVSLGFIRECESEARERNIDTGFPPDSHGDIADVLRLITERNRFPPFTGCRVSSTGFAADVRTEIERLVESASMANSCLFSQRLAEDPSKHHSLGSGLVGGGGLYCGVLTANCTHLIAQSPEGEKFKFAKSRSIPVVSLEWFIQCLRARARQSEDEYTVDHGEQSVYTNGMAPAATNLRRLQSLDHAKQKTELVSSQASDSRGFCKHASAPLPKRAPSATSAQSGIPLTIEPVTGSGVSRQSGLVAPKALNRPRAVSSESGYADPCDLFPSSLAGVDSGEDSDVVCLVDRPAAPIPRLRPPQPPPPRAASAAFESCRIALSQYSLSLAKRHEWRSKIAAARGECISEDSLLPAHAIHDSSSGQWTHYIVDDSGELCDDDVRALQLACATEMRPRPLVVRCGWLGECWRTGRRAKEASYSIPWPELCAEPNLGVVKSHGVPFAALEHLSATGSSTPTRQPTKPRPISLPMARQPLGDSVGIGSLAINSGGGTSKHAITTDSSAEDENSCQKSAKRPRRQPRGLSPSTASRGAAMDTHMTAASLQLRLVDGDSSLLRTELSTRSVPLAHLSSQARSTPQTTFTVATSDCSGGGGSAVFARCVFTSLGLPASAVVKFKGVVRENGGTFIDVFGSCPSATSPQPRARPQAPDPSIDWVLNTFVTNIDGAAVTDAYVVIPLRGMDEMAACEVAVRRYPSIHIVTECWVDQCVHDSLRYPDYCAIQALRLPYPGLSAGQHIVFRPLKSTRIAGAESLSLSISGYEGTERDHISILAQALGIEFSQRLPRTTTHLICRRPFSGPKYERALKWGLQVVDSTWFYALVAAGNVSDIDTGNERQSIAVIG